jgi:hypothetical protein
MAEVDLTSVPATDTSPGSSSNPVQIDVDALKREVTDLKTKFEFLTNFVNNLANVKVEEVGRAQSWFTILSPPPAFDLLPLVGVLFLSLIFLGPLLPDHYLPYDER